MVRMSDLVRGITREAAPRPAPAPAEPPAERPVADRMQSERSADRLPDRRDSERPVTDGTAERPAPDRPSQRPATERARADRAASERRAADTGTTSRATKRAASGDGGAQRATAQRTERPPAPPVSTRSTPAERESPAANYGTAASAHEAAALLQELQTFLTEARGVLQGGGTFSWGRLQQLLDRAITALAQSPDLFWMATDPAAPPNADYVAFHQARVCVLALRIGSGLGYDRGRLASLGQAAALFDVGLWQLPEAVLRHGDGGAGDELAQWRAHPRVSADIVSRWKPEDPSIARTVLEHHEREHGQGFPQGLHGAAIATDAKIVGLADTYATLTAPPPSRPRLKPHEAIRDIVKTRNDQFPAVLVKALLAEISVFPPGTIVRLNTEEVGRVIAVNRHHPLRPKVEIVADARGKRLPTPKIIDLSEAPFLYITGPVAEAGR